MTRLFGEHVRRSGEPKRAYPTREAAARGLPQNQAVHQCSLCGHWHRHTIGTPRPRR